MSCTCEAPLLKFQDGKLTRWCLHCHKFIREDAMSSDQTVKEFWDRLGAAIYPRWGMPEFEPDLEWVRYRAEAEAREREGREKFGGAYLSRKNLKDADEEDSDGSNYVFFDVLQWRHTSQTDRDDDIDLALESARHRYIAYCCDRKLERKRRGSI